MDFYTADIDKGEECETELVCKMNGNTQTWKGDKKRKKCAPMTLGGNCG